MRNAEGHVLSPQTPFKRQNLTLGFFCLTHRARYPAASARSSASRRNWLRVSFLLAALLSRASR